MGDIFRRIAKVLFGLPGEDSCASAADILQFQPGELATCTRALPLFANHAAGSLWRTTDEKVVGMLGCTVGDADIFGVNLSSLIPGVESCPSDLASWSKPSEWGVWTYALRSVQLYPYHLIAAVVGTCWMLLLLLHNLWFACLPQCRRRTARVLPGRAGADRLRRPPQKTNRCRGCTVLLLSTLWALTLGGLVVGCVLYGLSFRQLYLNCPSSCYFRNLQKHSVDLLPDYPPFPTSSSPDELTPTDVMNAFLGHIRHESTRRAGTTASSLDKYYSILQPVMGWLPPGVFLLGCVVTALVLPALGSLIYTIAQRHSRHPSPSPLGMLMSFLSLGLLWVVTGFLGSLALVVGAAIAIPLTTLEPVEGLARQGAIRAVRDKAEAFTSQVSQEFSLIYENFPHGGFYGLNLADTKQYEAATDAWLQKLTASADLMVQDGFALVDITKSAAGVIALGCLIFGGVSMIGYFSLFKQWHYWRNLYRQRRYLQSDTSDTSTELASALAVARNDNAIQAIAKGDLSRLDSIDSNTPLDAHMRNTPLHYAAFFGNMEAAKLLLERGARPGTTNMLGFKPQQIAVMENHPEVASMLEEIEAQAEGLEHPRLRQAAVDHGTIDEFMV
ncbi:MAG: uncharacterized protein KVP18_004739 [Porospora cf. gigantea A]|uniref:uncharacterized protein n=1 Tax=Porospora cf. gigantea A TaxID=2853593 RepID=UPI00355A4078|nr:MAG: hypothetical protein KVP18_004739 [Porospora cf. gigantea A]